MVKEDDNIYLPNIGGKMVYPIPLKNNMMLNPLVIYLAENRSATIVRRIGSTVPEKRKVGKEMEYERSCGNITQIVFNAYYIVY